MKTFRKLIAALLAFGFFATLGLGQTILASWNLDGTGPTDNTPTTGEGTRIDPYLASVFGTQDPGLTVASLTVSDGLAPSIRGGGFWQDTFSTINWNSQTDVATSIAEEDYYMISFSTDQVMNLTSLSLRLSSQSQETVEFAILADVNNNGFDASDVLGGQTFTATNTNPTDVLIDLTGGDFDNIADVEFRIYGFAGRNINNGPNSGSRLAIGLLGATDGVNDVALRGTVIPEPAHFAALFSLVALGIALRRKHKAAK